MASVRPIVEALWQRLGLAPPLEEIGPRFEFEIGDIPITLTLEPNGDSVTMRSLLGYLDPDPHQAGSQLTQLLRLGLGLAASNSAALDAHAAQAQLDMLNPDMPAEIAAIAVIRLNEASGWVPALEDMVVWKGYAEPVLGSELASTTPGASGTVANRTATGQTELDQEMIIFQP